MSNYNIASNWPEILKNLNVIILKMPSLGPQNPKESLPHYSAGQPGSTFTGRFWHPEAPRNDHLFPTPS